MKTRIVAAVGIILAFGLLLPGGGTARAVQSPADCAGLDRYIEAYHQVGIDYMTALNQLDPSRMETWTAAEFLIAQTSLDSAISAVSALTPPAIAEPLQAKAIESLHVLKAMLAEVETNGLLSALPYVDRVNAASDELDAIAIPMEEHCQIAILDNDDDGVPEIGPGVTLGTTADVDPNAALGSYANPYQMGVAQTTSDGWSIRVDSVIPDGTQHVLAENSFNQEPLAGRQFFIATITATYTGQGAESFDGNFRLRVRGANDAIYTAFGDACGVTPNEWDEHIVVASGESLTGNLCWSVPTNELPYLRMFDKQTVKSGMPGYWSLGQETPRSPRTAVEGIRAADALVKSQQSPMWFWFVACRTGGCGNETRVEYRADARGAVAEPERADRQCRCAGRDTHDRHGRDGSVADDR